MLDVLCIGDSVIDIFLKIPSDDPRFKLDRNKKQLLINYGEKINVKEYIIDIGGNATNTAVGLSRLGISVGLCAEIGNDEFSRRILSNLKKENIDTSFLIWDSNKQTSITVALSYKGDRTLFTEHVVRNHNFSFDRLETRLIYLTSLGNTWEKTYQKVYEFVKEKNVLLAFNPGALQIEKRDKYVFDIIEKTDYLFLNKEEAELILYGKELDIVSQQAIKKLLFGLKSLGAKNVIITDSDNGSFCQDSQENLIHLGIIKVDVLEKTGAGDAFNAGFLAAILKGESIENALLWGTINSSSVIQRIGAQEGLMKEKELKEKISSLKDISFENFT